MVHRAVDEYKRSLRGAHSVARHRRVGSSSAPGILFSVDDGETVIRDMVATVLVRKLEVWRGGDVEGFAADDGGEGEIDEAADEREDGFGHAGAGLQEAPLGAVLVGPGAPALGEVVLRVEGCVVRVVAAVDVVCAGRDERFFDPADEVEHCRC